MLYYWYAQFSDFQKLAELVWILPLIPSGVLTGRWMGDRVSKVTFERIIVSLLGIAGILLVLT